MDLVAGATSLRVARASGFPERRCSSSSSTISQRGSQTRTADGCVGNGAFQKKRGLCVPSHHRRYSTPVARPRRTPRATPKKQQWLGIGVTCHPRPRGPRSPRHLWYLRVSTSLLCPGRAGRSAAHVRCLRRRISRRPSTRASRPLRSRPHRESDPAISSSSSTTSSRRRRRAPAPMGRRAARRWRVAT